MYLYAVALVFLLLTIVFFVQVFIHYKKSGNASLSEEERSEAAKKTKNDLLFIGIFALLFEITLLITRKVIGNS